MRSSDDRVYLAPVDHLRAGAAVLVVLYHGCQLIGARLEHRAFSPGTDWLYSANPLAALVFEGHTAVALFMVLSGFVFTVGAHGRPVRAGRFLANRLLRIYPLYLVVAVLGTATRVALPDAGELLRIATLATPVQPYGGVFWTLCVEMQFYLVFPLLNRLLTERGPGALLRLLGAVALLRALVWLSAPGPVPDTAALYLGLAGRIDQFLLGMLAAWAFLHHRERLRSRWLVPGALTLAVATLWAFNQLHGYVSDSPLKLLWSGTEGAVWALVVAGYVANGPAHGAVSRAVARVGEVSFSVYLTHFMVLTALCAYVPRDRPDWWPAGLPPVWGAFAAALLVALPVTLALSFVTYHAVELPFLRLRRPYTGPATAPRPPAAATTTATTTGTATATGTGPGPEPGTAIGTGAVTPSAETPRPRRLESHRGRGEVVEP
ncbi:acyltransferase [Streptomyces sp. LP05-1]|uniref:Acyltransferase n=1 Tax=Streptomyces pyxinae TaxID=2970734 RepID=A0ABT2CI34_9ACTN|nr:acyltransferase [Streptomyces sp. LP05-1]MCS0637078.1 acyltransferase [Streptomyces sp. LP05-1]